MSPRVQSDSHDDRPAVQVFKRQRSVHKILGGRKDAISINKELMFSATFDEFLNRFSTWFVDWLGLLQMLSWNRNLSAGILAGAADMVSLRCGWIQHGYTFHPRHITLTGMLLPFILSKAALLLCYITILANAFFTNHYKWMASNSTG